MNLDGEDWGFVGYSGNQVPGNGGFTADLAGRYSNLQGTFNKMPRERRRMLNRM